MKNGGLFLAPSIILLVFGAVAVLASDRDLAGAVVVVSVTSETGAAETVPRVIRTATVVSLAAEGVVALELDDTVTAGNRGFDRLLDIAESSDGDFLLSVVTSQTDAGVRMRFEFLNVSDRRRVSTVESVEPLDLTFDRAVAGAVHAILADTRTLIADAAAARRETLPETVTAVTPGTGAPSGGPPDGPRPAIADRGVMPERQIVVGEVPGEQRRDVVSFAVGFSPFAPMGLAAAYYEFGLGASAYAHAVFGRNDILAVGGFARIGTIDVRGVAAGARLTIVPFGASVRLSVRPTPFAPFVRLLAGSGFFRLYTETLGRLEKFVPYAGVDLGVRGRVFGSMGLELGLGIESIFEGSVPMMHVVPAVSVTAGF